MARKLKRGPESGRAPILVRSVFWRTPPRRQSEFTYALHFETQGESLLSAKAEGNILRPGNRGRRRRDSPAIMVNAPS
jgi:hypothetical protein